MTNARVAAMAMVRTMKKMASARQEQLVDLARLLLPTSPPPPPPALGFS